MSTFSCAEFRRWLDEAVESRLAVEAGPLADHAALCAACGELWQQARLIHHAVAAWLSQTPQADLAESVLARFAFERDHVAEHVSNDVRVPLATRATQLSPSAFAPARFTRPHARGLAAVAMLVLAVATWSMFRSSNNPTKSLDDRQANSAPVVSPVSVAVADANADPDELESLVRNAGSAYLVLARDAAGAVVDASRIAAPTERLAVVLAGDRDDAETNSRQPAKQDGQPKPIGRQFGEALQFLFDAEPPEGPPSA